MFMILLIDADDAFRLGMDVADYFYEMKNDQMIMIENKNVNQKLDLELGLQLIEKEGINDDLV
ncbi:MAG: hypothetical protein EZS28_052038, partial [Streblomastix strix]